MLKEMEGGIKMKKNIGVRGGYCPFHLEDFRGEECPLCKEELEENKVIITEEELLESLKDRKKRARLRNRGPYRKSCLR